MALTGELSDLSLAELIEFFCNQRKSGRLEVVYASGPSYFYLQSGSVVDAEIGVLRGIEAIYYALTLPNASFTFDASFAAPSQTINQPWTSVVLEGLRRMDEGIAPANPFPDGAASQVLPEPNEEPELVATIEKPVAPDIVSVLNLEGEIISADPEEEAQPQSISVSEPAPPSLPSFRIEPPLHAPAFFSGVEPAGNFAYGPRKLSAIFGAVILIVAVIAVPWGWYARSKAAKLTDAPLGVTTEAPQPSVAISSNNAMAQPSEQPPAITSATPSNVADTRQREARLKEEARIRAKNIEPTTAAPISQPSLPTVVPAAVKNQSAPPSTSKKVTVQVTYDENGRVTQASGGDATALRIARQKRFPAGKAGSATVTIPIN